jgi:hypothetical protein
VYCVKEKGLSLRNIAKLRNINHSTELLNWLLWEPPHLTLTQDLLCPFFSLPHDLERETRDSDSRSRTNGTTEGASRLALRAT